MASLVVHSGWAIETQTKISVAKTTVVYTLQRLEGSAHCGPLGTMTDRGFLSALCVHEDQHNRVHVVTYIRFLSLSTRSGTSSVLLALFKTSYIASPTFKKDEEV